MEARFSVRKARYTPPRPIQATHCACEPTSTFRLCPAPDMGMKLKNFGLIGLGVIAGAAATVQFSALAQKETVAPLPLDQIRQLADVYGIIKSDYVEPVADKKLLDDAIAGMVDSLDPHSSYLDKQAYKKLREDTQGKFVGLGIEITMNDDGNIKVVSPIEDAPAWKAGIKAGDVIVRLDSTPVKGMTIDEAMKKMRGEPNTKITLTILRKNEDKPIVLTITRQEIKIQSIKGKIVEPGYAWVRITQFQDPTVTELAKKITALYAQDPKLKGLVLDLRNDPGGVLPGAIGVAAAFLPKNSVIVSTNGQMAESKQTFYAQPEYYAAPRSPDPLSSLPEGIKKIPMVVLINSGTASASEIVSGALQDYKRATIMGTQSFGKGSVQTIRQISPDTAIKITTARYYTPNGRSIQATGIVPNLIVDEYADGDGLDALRVREVDLQKHLSNPTDKAADTTKSKPENLENELKIIEKNKKRGPIEFGSKDDFQLQQALNFLEGKPVKTAKPAPVTDKVASKDAAKPEVKAEAPVKK